MADKKISQLTGATTPLAGTEVLPIVQSGSTVKVSAADVTAGRAVSALTYTSTATTGTAPFTVSSTTQVANLNAATAGTASNLLSNATTGVLQVTGPGAGTTRVMTTPNANFTAARTDAGQTFTGTQLVTGGVAVGSSDSLFTGIGGYTPQAQTRAGDTNSSGFGVFAFTSGGVGRVQVNRSKSTTIGTNTALASGDVVGIVQYGAADGTDYIDCADIRAYVDGAVSTNVVPGRLSFWTNTGSSVNPVEQVRIDSSANMTVLNGNLVVGTAAKGIDFSANTHAAGMTSELLNWYEEGTFTATFTAFTTAPSTPITATAYYTRVGRLVTCHILFSNVDTTGASGAMLVQGLPFTPANIRALGPVNMGGLGVVAGVAVASSGNTTIEIWDITQVNNLNIVAGSGKTLGITIAYTV